MIPAQFSYAVATTVEEAVRLLGSTPGARALAGGQNLVPLMKRRAATPSLLVDINRIPDLAYIKDLDGVLCIGAMTRDAALESSVLLKSRCLVVAETAASLGDALVRGVSTIGGNIAAGEGTSDHAATLLVLGADLVLHGPNGRHTVPIASFFVNDGMPRRRDDELIVEIRIRMPRVGSGAAFEKLARRTGDSATVAVAAALSLNDLVVASAGIGLAGVAPIPLRATEAEQFLIGKRADQATIGEAARLATRAAAPGSDVRASAEYREDMVRVLTERALFRAANRASGSVAQGEAE
ncbi:MAG: nicotine dehydrogenase chain [Chloroflexi bacterium]|nr:nicotine dehydrogenase chain [Chloroflexota bacterium]